MTTGGLGLAGMFGPQGIQQMLAQKGLQGIGGGGGGGFLSALGGLPGIGMGLTGLAGIAGIAGNRKAQKQQKRFLDQALKAYTNATKENEAFQSIARGEQSRALTETNKGFDKAMQSASGAQSEALRSIGDIAKMGRSAATERAFRSGTANSTLAANARNQAGVQAMRASGGVAQKLAGVRAGLHSQKGLAMANQRNRLAQGYLNQGQTGVQDAQGLVNLLGSIDVQGGGNMAGIGQLLAMLNQKKK